MKGTASCSSSYEASKYWSIIRHKHIVENYKLSATVATYYKLSAATNYHLSHVNTLLLLLGGREGGSIRLILFLFP